MWSEKDLNTIDLIGFPSGSVWHWYRQYGSFNEKQVIGNYNTYNISKWLRYGCLGQHT